MKHRTLLPILLAAAVLLALWPVAAQAAVTFDWATVGNPGNAGEQSRLADYSDTTYYGGVDYEYRISKFEVTAGQYAEFLNAVAKSDPHGLYSPSMDSSQYGCQITRHGSDGNYSYDFSGGTTEAPGSTAADWENRPVNYVSFWDAARFCNWLHNGQGSGDTESGAYSNIGDQANFARQPGAKYFIPTEDEWYKAAYHKNDGITANYWDYPTGSDATPSNVLNGGNSATFYYDNGYTIGSPYYRTEVGAHAGSPSPYGTFDQGGNLAEWNEALVSGSSRGLRGGHWDVNAYYLAASARDDGNPPLEGDCVGFRVASVPEPGSITLLVCGLVGVLMWWRRRK